MLEDSEHSLVNNVVSDDVEAWAELAMMGVGWTEQRKRQDREEREHGRGDKL